MMTFFHTNCRLNRIQECFKFKPPSPKAPHPDIDDDIFKKLIETNQNVTTTHRINKELRPRTLVDVKHSNTSSKDERNKDIAKNGITQKSDSHNFKVPKSPPIQTFLDYKKSCSSGNRQNTISNKEKSNYKPKHDDQKNLDNSDHSKSTISNHFNHHSKNSLSSIDTSSNILSKLSFSMPVPEFLSGSKTLNTPLPVFSRKDPRKRRSSCEPPDDTNTFKIVKMVDMPRSMSLDTGTM